MKLKKPWKVESQNRKSRWAWESYFSTKAEAETVYLMLKKDRSLSVKLINLIQSEK
jgi:hypothetical protein